MRCPQARVRLYFPLVELSIKPDMQCFHYWPALFLVETETLFGRHALPPRRFVESVNFTQTLQYESALQWEVRCDFHKVAAGMRQTMRDNDFQLLGQVAR